MRQVSLGINPRKTVHSERPGQVPGLFRRRRAQRVTVFAPQRTMPSPLPLYLPRARRAAPLVPVFFQSRPSPSKRARPQGRGIRGIPLSIGSNAGLRKTASFCPGTPSLHLTPPQRPQARCTSGRKRTLRAHWLLFRPLPAPTPALLSAVQRSPRGMWCILRSPLLCSLLFSAIMGRAPAPVPLLMVKRHLLFSIRKSPMPVARPRHEASANPQKKDASATYGRRRAGRGFPESVLATPLPAGGSSRGA